MDNSITPEQVNSNTSFVEGGGAIRPSPSRTALVVSADGEIRADWAQYFEELGMRTLRCVGPQVMCALLSGDERCPLHEEADFAIYERASVTPELTLKLIRPARPLPIAFAKDRISDDGRHRPQITSLASEAQGRGCFGTPPGSLDR